MPEWERQVAKIALENEALRARLAEVEAERLREEGWVREASIAEVVCSGCVALTLAAENTDLRARLQAVLDLCDEHEAVTELNQELYPLGARLSTFAVRAAALHGGKAGRG